MVVQLQLPPQLRAGDFTAQELTIPGERLSDLLRSFVEELHAEVAYPQREHSFHKFRAGLRLGVEHRVATTHVCLERMLHSDAVAEFDIMHIARPAAVAIVLPFDRNAQNTQCSM